MECDSEFFSKQRMSANRERAESNALGFRLMKTCAFQEPPNFSRRMPLRLELPRWMVQAHVANREFCKCAERAEGRAGSRIENSTQSPFIVSRDYDVRPRFQHAPHLEQRKIFVMKPRNYTEGNYEIKATVRKRKAINIPPGGLHPVT